MVANFNDRTEVEHFLRDASAAELTAQRQHLQDLMASVTPPASEGVVKELAARIAYELRFRVQQTI
ncbi:MAG: hypothetical protein Q7U97_03380 [Rhodocyclaceae bacterium]|nr:hypothetical protein [Rhodocyclaceae bacterium]